MQPKENISYLLAGFFSDVLSQEELERLYRCFRNEDYTGEITEWLCKEWMSRPYGRTDNVPSEELFARIKAEIARKERSMPKRRRLRPWVRSTLRYAAVAAMAFGLSRFWSGAEATLISEDEAPVVFNEILVPYGSKTMIVLSDSTQIWLNAGARLKYPTRFAGDRREVFLQGEGFFDVTKDAEHPFYVSTNGMNIKVLGTKFNLMANADDNKIEATLVEGAIEVLGVREDMQGGNLKLKPGQKLTLQKEDNSFAITPVVNNTAMVIPQENEQKVKIKSANLYEDSDISGATAWTENRLVFVRERFEDVKVRLERWYGVTIEVQDPEIMDYRFSGTFEKQTVEQAMTAFGEAASCHFKIINNKVVVSKI